MEPEYPQGLRDFRHHRWEEIMKIYVKYYATDQAVRTTALDAHIEAVIIELKRRQDNE